MLKTNEYRLWGLLKTRFIFVLIYKNTFELIKWY